MTVAFRSTSNITSSTNVSTLTCPAPAGLTAGDVLLAVVSQYFNAPAGWTLLSTGPPLSGGSYTPSGFESFWYRLATNAEPASYVFTNNGQPTLSGGFHGAVVMAAFSGSAALDVYQGNDGGASSLTSLAANAITTTIASEFIVSMWAITGTTAITLPGGQTSRASVQDGASPGSSIAIGTYTGPVSPGSSSPGTATFSSASHVATCTVALKIAVPLAPTLTALPNNSYSDVATNGGPFTWNYNTGGATGSETGYNFRRKISGGSYNYWNAGSSSFQVGDLTNTSPATSLTFGAAVWTNGNVYNWSVASTDVAGEGPYAADFTVTAQAAPTVSVTAPTGTDSTTQTPAVTWTDTLAGGATQLSYRVVTYNSTQYSAGGFSPGVSPGVDDSGVVTSTALTYTIASPLPNGVSYRSYVQVVQTPGGNTSAWSFTSFTVSLDTLRTPTLTAAYGTDGVTGCPRIGITVTTQDNILSTNDSSFEGGLGTTTAITNCAVAQSATQAEDGTQSCRMTSTASGNMSAGTASGLSGYVVLPNTPYTFRSDYRSAVSARSCRTDIAWYNAAGTLISTTAGTAVNDTTSGWTTSATTATSPALSAFARLIHNVLATGAGSEIHYVDEAGVFPGTVATWTIGGFVGISSLQILRSDGLYVRLASTATPAAVSTPSQVTTVYDYEATPGTAYTYTAVAVSGTLASASSAASNSASVPTGLGYWEIDPTNYSSAVNAQPTAWNTVNYEQSAAHPVLQQTTANVVASAMQVSDINATFSLFSAAKYLALYNLITSQKTIFVSDPFGFSYYFRLAPAPGGMSSGVGNKAHDAQLQASTAAAPYRIVPVTGIGQPRPQV